MLGLITPQKVKALYCFFFLIIKNVGLSPVRSKMALKIGKNIKYNV